VETVETVLSSFYLYIAHDLNRGLCKLQAKNGFNHLNEAKIFQTRLPCPIGVQTKLSLSGRNSGWRGRHSVRKKLMAKANTFNFIIPALKNGAKNVAPTFKSGVMKIAFGFSP
jgi:hypothetical protein